ncbi:MAG: TonB-dependent receptor [Pseudomonadota bacterium]
MARSAAGRARFWRGTGILLSAILPISGALAQTSDDGTGLEDVIVVTGARQDDTTLIAPDAASLLATAGDVNDPIKALLALPGITFAGGDLDPPVIRGGGPADNLFLVDGIPVENLFHELSDSIVSPNVVRTFDLHAAAWSPAYGNAVGGVIDIGLRDPSADDASLRIDLSQLKSGILVEAPLTGRVSAYAAYRHNLAHLLLDNFERGNDVLRFKMPESRDYAARAIWRGDGFDLGFTLLGSWDRTEEEANPDVALPVPLGEVEVRQTDVQAVWLRADIGERGRLTTTLSHSDIRDDLEEANGSFVQRDRTVWALRTRFDRDFGDHRLSLGVNLTRSDDEIRFRGRIPLCDFFERDCGQAFSVQPVDLDRSFTRSEFHASGEIALADSLSMDIGVQFRVDHFLDESSVDPRIGLTYRPSDGMSLYARAAVHHQAPAADRLLLLGGLAGRQRSIRSRQALIGQRWNLGGAWRLQTELWYKDFDQPDLVGTPLELDIEGEAYGVDILLARTISERLHGWAALSLSEGTRTRRDSGATFDDRYTAPFSATIALRYAFDNGWRIGAKYRAQSGAAYTPLDSVAIDPGTDQPSLLFGDPFSARLRDYHRLDIRLERGARYSFGDVTYYVDILNVMDRTNRSNRRFPLRNTIVPDTASPRVLPDDEEGIPFFVALGVNFAF